MSHFTIYVDGACSGNPGPAGIGVQILDDNKEIVCEISRSIGEATNNIAEYTAMILALQEGLLRKARRLSIFTDSELVSKQVRGEYKVKEQHLQFLCYQVQRLMQGFENVHIQHIPREKNKAADKLATASIEKGKIQDGCLFD